MERLAVPGFDEPVLRLQVIETVEGTDEKEEGFEEHVNGLFVDSSETETVFVSVCVEQVNPKYGSGTLKVKDFDATK